MNEVFSFIGKMQKPDLLKPLFCIVNENEILIPCSQLLHSTKDHKYREGHPPLHICQLL